MTIYKEELEKYLINHTNVEAAQHFGKSIRSIARLRNKFGLTYESVKYGHIELNSLQKELLLASLLGDGTIEKQCARFKFGQTIAKKEYVDWVYNILKPTSREPYLDTGKGCHLLDGRSIKPCKSWRFYTIAHPYFRELRAKWYDGRIKRIPPDIALNAYILAHWIIQDGTNNQKKRSFTVYTNSFNEQDVLFLIEVLKRDLDISATLNFCKKKPVIYIGAYEYLKVIEIIRPHVFFDCFDYKIDTSQCVFKANKALGAGKLNKEKASEIRVLHRDGTSIPDLAKEFNVTENSIYNVLNNVTYYSKPDFATVSVVYNPASCFKKP